MCTDMYACPHLSSRSHGVRFGALAEVASTVAAAVSEIDHVRDEPVPSHAWVEPKVLRSLREKAHFESFAPQQKHRDNMDTLT